MKAKIHDIMSRDPVTVEPYQTIEEAAQMMKHFDTGFLPVGSCNKVHGVLTDRDIVLRCIAEGKVPAATEVHEIMSGTPRYCEQDDNLDSAAEKMRKHNVSRLIVTDGHRVVGILSLADLVRANGRESMSDRMVHDLLYTD